MAGPAQSQEAGLCAPLPATANPRHNPVMSLDDLTANSRAADLAALCWSEAASKPPCNSNIEPVVVHDKLQVLRRHQEFASAWTTTTSQNCCMLRHFAQERPPRTRKVISHEIFLFDLDRWFSMLSWHSEDCWNV